MKLNATTDGAHIVWVLLTLLLAALLFCPLLWLFVPAVAHAQAVPPPYILSPIGKLQVDSAGAGRYLWTNSRDSSLEVKARDSGGIWVYWPDSTKWVHISAAGFTQYGSGPYRYYFRDLDTAWYLEAIDGTPGNNDSLRFKFPDQAPVTVYPSAPGGGGGEVTSNSATVNNEITKYSGATGDTLTATGTNPPTISSTGLLTVPGGITGSGGASADAIGLDSVEARKVKTGWVVTDSVGKFTSESDALILWPDEIRPDDSGMAIFGTDGLPLKSGAFSQLKLRFLEGGVKTWYVTDTTSTAVNTYVLSANTSNNTMYWAAPGAGGGEVNTASNIAGSANNIGVWKDKSTYDLRFKGLVSTSNLLTIANGTSSDSIIFTVNQGNMTLSSIGGSVTNAQVPNDITVDLATDASQLGTVAAAEYLRRSGIVPLTGNWALGSYDLQGGRAVWADTLRGNNATGGYGVRVARIDSLKADTIWAGRIDPDTLHMSTMKITGFGSMFTLSGSTLNVDSVGKAGIGRTFSDGTRTPLVAGTNGQVLAVATGPTPDSSYWKDDATGGGGGAYADSSGILTGRNTLVAKFSGQQFQIIDTTTGTDKVVISAPNDLLYVGDTTGTQFTVKLGTSTTVLRARADSFCVDVPLRVAGVGVYKGAQDFSGTTTTFAANDITETEIAQGTLDGTELEDGGVGYADLAAMTSANLRGILTDENGTGTILTTTGATSAINFSGASVTLAANEIGDADIDWPGMWEFPHGGQIVGQYGNITDSIFRTGEIYNGTPPNDTVWSSMDSCWDGSGDMLGIIPVVVQPPAWATTLDSVYIWAKHSSATAATVSLDSAVIYQQATDTSQMLTTRNTAITIADAGSTASVVTRAKPNVTVTGTAIPHTVKILLYYKADVSSSIRWRMKVRWDD